MSCRELGTVGVGRERISEAYCWGNPSWFLDLRQKTGGPWWDWGRGLLPGWVPQSAQGRQAEEEPLLLAEASPQLSALKLSKQSPCCAVCFLELNLGSWAEAELGEAVTSARELAGPHALTVLRGP